MNLFNSKTSPISLPKRRPNLLRFFHQHWQAMTTSFGKMSQAPLATLMTIAVIGIALALPCGLFVILENVQRIGAGWDNGTQISLYLKQDIAPVQAKQIAEQLRLDPDVDKVVYISPDDGLADFKRYSGFDDALAQLTDNPLPSVIEIHPSHHLEQPHAMQAFVQRLKSIPAVETSKLDMAWIKRLARMIELGERIIYGLALLLGFGVILIIGNTIRLATQNQRIEIKVIKLVGGTDAFIRRPFLYTGALYGSLGGIMAMVLVSIFQAWLSSPVQRLATLYNSHFTLVGLDNQSTFMLIVSGSVLGLLGSWLAVAKHLHDFDASEH